MKSLTAEQLCDLAALNGFTFTVAEVEGIRPAIESGLALLERLEALPVTGLDPAVQYRVV